jgi:hypothetical protein
MEVHPFGTEPHHAFLLRQHQSYRRLKLDHGPTAQRKFSTTLRAVPCGALAAVARFLNRRTRHVAIRAKYATVACFWFQPHTASDAVVEKLTRISRHRFDFGITAVWASNGGLQNHDISFWHGCPSKAAAQEFRSSVAQSCHLIHAASEHAAV